MMKFTSSGGSSEHRREECGAGQLVGCSGEHKQQRATKEAQNPDAALAAEQQRCQAELHQQIASARVRAEQRDKLQDEWGNWYPEDDQQLS